METDVYHLKLQLTQELERAVKSQRINQELYDHLLSTLQYLLKYARQSCIELPKPQVSESLERIHTLIDRANEVCQKVPTKYQQPDKTPSGIDRIILL